MGAYTASDGTSIAIDEQLEGNRTIIIALPGITEPKESIGAFAQGIIEHLADVDLVSADLYAQGSSTGEWDMNAMVQGFGELIDHYADRYGSLFLVGHSAGGIIAANASIGRMITGLVIINSPARPQEAVPAWLLEHAHVLPRHVLEAAVKAWDTVERMRNTEHPPGEEQQLTVLNMRIGDPNRFLERLKDAPGLVDAAEQVSAPTLFVYGGNQPNFGIREDRLNASIEQTLERWSSRADLSIIPSADHNLNERTWAGKWFNVDERYRWVRKDIARWINARIVSS